MVQNRITNWLRANVDSVDVWFTFHALAAFAVAAHWKDEIVRAIRGEGAEEDWRASVLPAVFIAFWTLTSGARVREMASLRGAAVELRGLTHDAAEQEQLRDQRAAERDRRATEQQDRMLFVNKLLLVLAALTLAAALVALAVTLAR